MAGPVISSTGCDVASWAPLGTSATDCPFLPGSSVEDGNPRLLPQHPCFACWLQDRPANRPEHPDGAVPPEAGAHLLRAGACMPLCTGGEGMEMLYAKDLKCSPVQALTTAREHWYLGAIYHQQLIPWMELVLTQIYAPGGQVSIPLCSSGCFRAPPAPECSRCLLEFLTPYG